MVCLFRDRKNNYLSVLQLDEAKHDVFCPISSNMLLVGSLSKHKPKVDLRKFREEYVKWSNGYFICSSYSEEINKLSKKIGKNLDRFIENESLEIIKKLT
jgi:hypothetical protein